MRKGGTDQRQLLLARQVRGRRGGMNTFLVMGHTSFAHERHHRMTLAYQRGRSAARAAFDRACYRQAGTQVPPRRFTLSRGRPQCLTGPGTLWSTARIFTRPWPVFHARLTCA